MRKIYLLPNLITTANMFCGFYSVVMSMQGEYKVAAWALIAAIVFDMLDGRIARMARATSSFGVEYDSMSDLISFGMAPGLLTYLWQLQPLGRLGWIAGFFHLACGALRLARFNISTGKLSKAYFQGLPSPAAAGSIASLVIFSDAVGLSAEEYLRPMALGLLITVAVLMVSSVPFPSFKELNWRSKTSFPILMAGVVFMVFMALKPEVTMFIALMLFILVTLAWNLRNMIKGNYPPPGMLAKTVEPTSAQHK